MTNPVSYPMSFRQIYLASLTAAGLVGAFFFASDCAGKTDAAPEPRREACREVCTAQGSTARRVYYDNSGIHRAAVCACFDGTEWPILEGRRP